MPVGVGVGHWLKSSVCGNVGMAEMHRAHTHADIPPTHTRTHTHTHLPKNHLGPPLSSSSLLQQHASSDGEEEWSGSGSE